MRAQKPSFPIPLVSIIIPTHNLLEEYTKPCLRSLWDNTQYPNYEVIVVDDKSTDGTREWLRDQPVTLIESDEEKFCYARNNNKGIRIARGEYVCLLNNDTTCHKQWLSKLLQLITSKNHPPFYGAVGPRPRDLKWENEDILMSPAGFLRFFCVLIKREVIEKIGLMDEKFQGYGYDDNEYSKRIKGAGYLLGMHTDELVEHHVSQTFRIKSREILQQLTGQNIGSDQDARERLFKLNEMLYRGILKKIPEPVKEKPKDDPRELFLDSLRNGMYYDHEYFQGKKGYKFYDERNVEWNGSAQEGLGNAIEEFKPSTILDVGCATGYVIREARRHGYQAFGIDISEWACRNAPPDVRGMIKCASATCIPYSDNDFDLIWCRDTLQCIEDVFIPRVIKEMERVCKPNGTIWIASLPAMISYSQRRRNQFEKRNEAHINIQTIDYWVDQFRRVNRRVVIWFALDADRYDNETLYRVDVNEITRKIPKHKLIRELVNATTH